MADDVIILPDENDNIIIVDDVDPSEIEVQTVKTIVIEGPGASEQVTPFPAGEVLEIGQLVYISGGKALKYQASNASLYGRAVGFAISDALMDQQVRVQFTGVVRKAGWGLTPDNLYYAKDNGLLHTLIDTQRIVLPVGVALDSERLKIEFGTSYIKRLVNPV